MALKTLQESTAFRNETPIWWLAILFVYIVLHNQYNIYYVDDPWMISNAWNYVRLGIPADLVFVEHDNAGYFQFFSLTYYFIMGSILEILGWTKTNAFLVNSIFVWATALVWWRILKHFPISEEVAKWVVLLIPIFPPFFFAAHAGRTEAFVMLLISLQLWAFIHKRFFLSAFLIGISVEVHLMGVLGCFYSFGYALTRKEDYFLNKKVFGKMLLGSLAGLGLAVGYYALLHGEYFSFEDLKQVFSGKRDMSNPTNSYLLSYFSDFDWYDHIWELILLLIVLVQYFKNRLFQKNPELAIFLLVIFISTIITRRENRNYFVLIVPALLMFYFYTYSELGKLNKLLKVLAVLLTLHYASHYFVNKNFHFEDLTQQIKYNLKKDIPVIGMPDVWWAAQEKEFCPIHHGRKFKRLDLSNFYLVQTDYLAHRNRDYFAFMDYFQNNAQCTQIKKISAGDKGDLLIWECETSMASLPDFVKPPNPGWKAIMNKYLNDVLGFKNEEKN